VVAAREAYVASQGDLDATRLVFLDEAGTSLAMSYNYGWAPPGEKPIIERPLRGKNVTLIGAIALDGIRTLRRVEGTVDSAEFLSFLRDDLGPTLNKGDIVVMDGPRLHRVAGVKETLAEFGAEPLYLPAYSPEFNPIEMAWSWIKSKIRKVAPRYIGVLRDVVARVWASVTSELCRAWIGHAGYAVAST
jgi:transposase